MSTKMTKMVFWGIVRKVRLLFHEYDYSKLEHKHLAFVNRAPNADPNPLSIYGPEGSYWLELHHCPICDRYSGRRYDTYGGFSMSDWEAQHEWLKDERKQQEGGQQ